MEFIMGFIIMLILVVISAIPIFVTLKTKKSYSNIFAWVLFVVCCLIYIVLKVICIEYGILGNSSSVPLIAMFIFYGLSRLGVVKTVNIKKHNENFSNDILSEKNDDLDKRSETIENANVENINEEAFSMKRFLLIWTVLIILSISVYGYENGCCDEEIFPFIFIAFFVAILVEMLICNVKTYLKRNENRL